MRIIDADALKELIATNVYPICDAFNSRDYGMFWTGGIEKAINEMPTIDAVEVVHGEWIDEPLASTSGGVYWTHRCSVCDWQQPYEVFKYCPYCGAKMGTACTHVEEASDE